jgi:hypothetical protein
MMKARLGTSPGEKRFDMRFDKVFPVLVGSELYGDAHGIARNMSAGGMLIEMADMLPLGSLVTVHFRGADGQSEIVARAEVKHHYCLNFATTGEPAGARGMGLRFVEFLEDSALDLDSFTRTQTFH